MALLAAAVAARGEFMPMPVHRWPFETNANDVIGTAHGTLVNAPPVSNGWVTLNGSSQYVDLPNNLFTNWESITIEAWVTDLRRATWARIYDFGNSSAGEGNAGVGTRYMFLTPNNGSSFRGAYTTTGGGGGEQVIERAGVPLPTDVMCHVVWATDGPSHRGRLYLDGVPVGSNLNVTITPAAIGPISNMWLGRSQFGADAYFRGRYADVRTYDVALTPEQVSLSFARGSNLVPADAAVAFYRSPASTGVVEGQTVTFEAGIAGRAPIALQWQRNGAAIPGATNIFLSFPPSGADHLASYRLRATNSVGGTNYAATSSVAVLTFIADLTAPSLLRASNEGTNGAVAVVFSEPMEAEVATNPACYSLVGPDGTVTVTSVTLDETGSTAFLVTGPLAIPADYTLTVRDLTDRAAAANVLAPNPSVARFSTTPFLLRDIGSAGAQIGVTNGGLILTAGGAAGLGGEVTDQCGFAFQPRTGDFDVQVRLGDLSLVDVWASAGLMARVTLDASSPFAASVATPTLAGSFFQYRAATGSVATLEGAFPVNYPEMWLRLKRSGNLFRGFAGYDGLTWTPLGSASLVLSNTLYVGVAVTSHSTNRTATAQLFAATDTVSTATGAVASGREPPGPCTRRTGLAITEIMARPAPRTDGRNLAFVELFNSNPYFHDLSGHRLSGDIDYVFPPGTVIPAGGLLVVAANPADLEAEYGQTGVLGPYANALGTAGTLRLRDERDTILLEIPRDDDFPWPMGADGTGHALALARPSYGEADPRAWALGDIPGGSPGRLEAFRPGALRQVKINELLAHTDPPQEDLVELYNHGNTAVDLSGCGLSDEPATNRFVMPPGTIIPARGFVVFTETQMGFALSAAGESLYFNRPGASGVLEALKFGAQENGVAFGRFPDGADAWRRLAALTAGTNNAAPRVAEVGVNEIMYRPISGRDDDQYVELYNRSPGAVDLAGWRLEDGVGFTFPAGTVLGPDGYLVVARNRTNLLARYSGLAPAAVCGDFSGTLARGGERLALTRPDTIVSFNQHGAPVTSTVHLVVDEVAYESGGAWGAWAAGGGSALELVDPRAGHGLAANWADSDETAKAPWTTIQATGILDLGANFASDPVGFAQIGQLDAGECLVDNVEVLPAAGSPNYAGNPGFALGLAYWSLQGCFNRSALEAGAGYGGAGNALRLRTGNRLFTLANSAQVTLTNTTLTTGQTATIRFKARWLKGCPEIAMRLAGNWLEASGAMAVPAAPGTPGARNSRAATNGPPAVFAVVHAPATPAAGEAVVVTARAEDPDGVASLTLRYRIEPAAAYTSVAFGDAGAGGDAVAGDGVYSATIPGQATGAVAAFVVTAVDGAGAAARFPALLGNGTPEREGLVRWGEPALTRTFGAYRLWLSQTNLNRWTSLPVLSNEDVDSTLVYNGRVIYGARARYAGSPYHQAFDGPTGNRACHYNWDMPADDRLLGHSSFNKIHWIGNDIQDDIGLVNANDITLQREQAANTFLRGLGQPWVYRRYVSVCVNGSRRGPLMEDALRASVSVPDAYFPDDQDGYLCKVQPWFEGGAAANGDGSWPWENKSWAYCAPYVTASGAYKQARYRWCYEPRRAPDRLDNFSHLYTLITAGTNYARSNWPALMKNIADMENWLRLVAANHAAGNWDCYGIQNGQNVYGYVGPQTRWTLFMFDFSIVLGNRISWMPGTDLEAIPVDDPVWQRIYSPTNGHPEFRRMYWRALKELAGGAMRPAAFDPLLDAKYAAFCGERVTAASPDLVKAWVYQARTSILQQVTARDTNVFALAAGTALATSQAARISGSAPLEAATITVGGVAWPIAWTTTTRWTAQVPVANGTNVFAVRAYDRFGAPVGGTGLAVTVINAAVPEPPEGRVVFHELMAWPAAASGEYVELRNLSSNTTYNLSGWHVNGLSYTFPTGSVLGPTSLLVLARSPTIFAATYGPTNPVFGIFSGDLQADGETLSLIKPGVAPEPDVVIDRVRYEAAPPWPAADALQLIDARQDNSRASNWRMGPAPGGTPARTNSVAGTIPPYPPIWLNEIQAENTNGPADGLGHREPWVEIYNAGTDTVSLAGFFLSDRYASLTNWAFPADAVVAAGGFLVVWCDGATNETGGGEYHASFRPAAGAGSVALSRLVTGTPQVVDYLNYTNLPANQSYGDVPDGQPFYRQTMYYATAGATNDAAVPYQPLYINEWMAGNTVTLANPAGGKYDDWFELYNPGATDVDLADWSLANSLTNPVQNVVPAGYVVPAFGHLLVWADGRPDRNATNHPDLHVSFQLSKSGETIALYDPSRHLVDAVTFGLQTNDISEGRTPDGRPTVVVLPAASPRAANAVVPPPAALALVGFDFSETNIVLTWTASSNYYYGVMVQDRFNVTPWRPLGPTLRATGAVLTLPDDVGTNVQRYYRVEWVP